MYTAVPTSSWLFHLCQAVCQGQLWNSASLAQDCIRTGFSTPSLFKAGHNLDSQRTRLVSTTTGESVAPLHPGQLHVVHGDTMRPWHKVRNFFWCSSKDLHHLSPACENQNDWCKGRAGRIRPTTDCEGGVSTMRRALGRD